MSIRALFGAFGLVIAAGVSSAAAQEVTLKGVTSFAEGTQFSKNFERFIEKVNKDGKGIMTDFQYVDGASVQPTDEQVRQWRPASAD